MFSEFTHKNLLVGANFGVKNALVRRSIQIAAALLVRDSPTLQLFRLTPFIPPTFEVLMTVESSVTPQISPGCSRCSRWLWLWRRPMHGNHNMSLVSVPAFSGRAASVFSVCDPTGHSRAWKCSSCQFTCSVQWQKTGPLERLLVHDSNDNPKLKRQISDDVATNYCKKNKKKLHNYSMWYQKWVTQMCY